MQILHLHVACHVSPDAYSGHCCGLSLSVNVRPADASLCHCRNLQGERSPGRTHHGLRSPGEAARYHDSCEEYRNPISGHKGLSSPGQALRAVHRAHVLFMCFCTCLGILEILLDARIHLQSAHVLTHGQNSFHLCRSMSLTPQATRTLVARWSAS